MASPFDPRISLALSLHSEPGTYALLLGSGASSAVGVPTGWDVVRSLVAQAAMVADPTLTLEAAETLDPDAWWVEHGDGQPLGYSNLLELLGDTPSVRRGLVSSFFEPSDDDRAQGLRVPGRAHRAIAELVRRGTIRVIVTTNFDRLIEDAIREAGVQPEVISNVHDLAGATPLVHSKCMVLKVHGDYMSLDQRHTAAELNTYPPEWDTYLKRVFDEHGLLVSGWSADWDGALVQTIRSSPTRRYPLYWASVGLLSRPALDLIEARRGKNLPDTPAEVLFPEVLRQLEALDMLADPPQSTAMAVATVKRFLPDPLRRIDLHDLFMNQVDRTLGLLFNDDRPDTPASNDDWKSEISRIAGGCRTLLSMLRAGVTFAENNAQDPLWVAVIARLLAGRRAPRGAFNNVWDDLKHLPALLALRTIGLAAIANGNDRTFLAVQTRPRWRSPYGARHELSAVDVLHDWNVLDGETLNGFAWGAGQRWLYPTSRLLKELLRPIFSDLDSDAYLQLSNRYEYWVALAQMQFGEEIAKRGSAPGEFIGDYGWQSNDSPVTEADFRASADTAAWGFEPDGSVNLDDALAGLAERLRRVRHFG